MHHRIASRCLIGVLVVTCAQSQEPGDGGGPVLSAVDVSPAAVTMAAGDSASFQVVGRMSDGSTASIAVNWSASGGTITSGGLYQAGGVAGTYRVIATVAAAARADTAQVVIPDTTMPSGGTLLFSETFENASVASRGWYDNTTPVITTAEFHGGSAALQMAWNVGATLPVHGGALRHKFTPTDRYYLRYWVKYSANWIGSGVNYHPHEFYVVTTEDGDYIGPSATHLTTYVEQVYQNGGIPRLAITDALNIDATKINVDLSNVTEHRAAAGCNGNTDGYPTGCYQSGGTWYNEKGWRTAQPMFTATTGPGYKNNWHKVEAYFQLNTITGGKGQADGIVQYWFDGQLVIDKRNVLFRTGAHPTMQFNQLLIGPYIGVGSPAAQTMWVDDLVVATGPVP